MAERGLSPWATDGILAKGDYTLINGKVISVEETFRMNGVNHGLNNVTVTLKVEKPDKSVLDGSFGYIHKVAKIKVPKNASERVIDRRIDQIEAILTA